MQTGTWRGFKYPQVLSLVCLAATLSSCTAFHRHIKEKIRVCRITHQLLQHRGAPLISCQRIGSNTKTASTQSINHAKICCLGVSHKLLCSFLPSIWHSSRVRVHARSKLIGLRDLTRGSLAHVSIRVSAVSELMTVGGRRRLASSKETIRT